MDKYQIFLNTTEEPSDFIIKDVVPDGDCGFRSCALNLNLYNLNLIKKLESKNYEHINNLTINYKKFNKKKQWDGWNYQGKKIRDTSLKIRECTINFMMENWDNPITDEILNIELYKSLGDFTLEYHQLDSKEKYYDEYIDNKKENGWVGTPELYSLSKLLGVTIEIYGLIRFFKNTETTMLVKLYKNGKVPINTRLRLIQIIGSKYNESKHKITILYDFDQKGLNHYLFLKKKS